LNNGEKHLARREKQMKPKSSKYTCWESLERLRYVVHVSRLRLRHSSLMVINRVILHQSAVSITLFYCLKSYLSCLQGKVKLALCLPSPPCQCSEVRSRGRHFTRFTAAPFLSGRIEAAPITNLTRKNAYSRSSARGPPPPTVHGRRTAPVHLYQRVRPSLRDHVSGPLHANLPIRSKLSC
jgi:hypothetical protein